LREFFAMTGNHSLRPDGDTENLHRLVRMEEHPDCQPRRTVTVNRCDDDDGDRNKDFERKRIDDSTSLI
jgi:hypothetical protein